MQEIIKVLVEKINNKTISLQDFSNILIDKNIENGIKFMALLCENPTIDSYLSSFFSNKKYTEEELIRRYGELNGNILTSYGIIKNLIKEEIIDYKEININSLDSVDLFFKDMSDLPILSKEDTLKYIKIYQEAKSLGKVDICDKYRNLIIEGNIRLIVYIAKKIASTDMTLLDLVNEGFFGMSKAIDYYDFSYGSSFSSYAYYWIKSLITRSIHNKERNIRIPVRVQEKYRKVMKVEEKLTNTLGREVSIKEIADEMNEDCANIEELVNNIGFLTSLDAEVKDDTETNRYNFVPDKINLEEAIVNKTAVLTFLECLTEREKDIITKRYGEDYTLEEIGKMYKMTRERVRQIEEKALGKMQNFLKNNTKSIQSEKNERIILNGKTLIDLIGKEKVNDFDYCAKVSTYIRTLFYKAFGPNLDEVYKDNLNSKEATYLKQAVKNIINNDYKSYGKEYSGKTLNEIFALDNIDLLWKELTRKDNTISNIFIKAFGPDGKGICNLDNLSYYEKSKVVSKISKLMSKKEQGADTFSPKKLNEMLRLSYEDTIRFVNALDKNEELYKAFGNELNEFLDKSKFSEKDYAVLLRRLGMLSKIAKEDNIYKGKTLEEIINESLSDIKMVATPTNLEVLTKAFGENLDLKFINNVSLAILAKTLEKIKNRIDKKSKVVSKISKLMDKKQQETDIFNSKKLNEILGLSYEDTERFMNVLDKNEDLYKAFGNDLNEFLDKSKFSENDYALLLRRLDILSKIAQEDNIYKGKTLEELINESLSDIKLVATPTNLEVLTKAFGENLDLKFINNVSLAVLAKTLEKIKNRINNKSRQNITRNRKSRNDGKTLNIILGITYEEVLNIFNSERKNTKIYSLFVKVFGSDFTKTYDTSYLTKNEKNILRIKINNLKEKIKSRTSKEETTNLNNDAENLKKYYKVIIDFMPEDYKLILYLFLGIFNEKYSIKQIAKFLRISEEEVSLKVDTGMTFIKTVINAYNKTFTNSKESIHYDSTLHRVKNSQ